MIMFNSLPNSYKKVKVVIKFGKKSITLDEVTATLHSQELELKSNSKASSSESLNVQG